MVEKWSKSGRALVGERRDGFAPFDSLCNTRSKIRDVNTDVLSRAARNRTSVSTVYSEYKKVFSANTSHD